MAIRKSKGYLKAMESLAEYEFTGKSAQEKQYEIYLFGRKSICPVCKGLLTSTGNLQYHCIDCSASFSVVDMGRSDDKAICEKV